MVKKTGYGEIHQLCDFASASKADPEEFLLFRHDLTFGVSGGLAFILAADRDRATAAAR